MAFAGQGQIRVCLYIQWKGNLIRELYASSTSPSYSHTEVGVSVHAILVGVDAGVDPVGGFDLVVGFLFIGIRGDVF